MSAEGSGLHRAQITGPSDSLSLCSGSDGHAEPREAEKWIILIIVCKPIIIKFWNRHPARFVGRRTGKNIRSPPKMQSASVCK